MRPWLRIRSMRLRLTLMLGVISVVVFAGAGELMHGAIERELSAQQRALLAEKLRLAQHLVQIAETPAQVAALWRRLYDLSVDSGNLRIWLIDSGGNVLHGGQQAPTILSREGGLVTVRQEDGTRLLGEQARVYTPGPLGQTELTVAIEIRSGERLMEAHDRALYLISGLGIALTFVLSAWAAYRGLTPVHALSAQAAQISPESLGVRLPIQNVDDELRSLASAFNRVLDSLEKAYKQMEGFNADVAHELRTPLAIMISGTQLALAAERPIEELRETLASNLEELEQMKRLVSDMLFLAEADTGKAAPDLAPVSIAQEARSVADYLEPVAEERHIQFRIEGDATVQANASLLRRALLNLASNALNHSSDGTIVSIAVSRGQNGRTRIAVRNPGPPIPESDLPRIFDRFYRGDLSRPARGESHGLGLAIVRAIAGMHGGTTFAASRNGVTEVGLEL
jgi:two-component system heavy metal sensor histidine kinase CusS